MQTKNKILNVRISEAAKNALVMRANRMGMSVSDYVVYLSLAEISVSDKLIIGVMNCQMEIARKLESLSELLANGNECDIDIYDVTNMQSAIQEQLIQLINYRRS